MSYCETELGLNYACDEPLPRSSFNLSGPLCSTVAEYLYDPANCDPGYWCGCTTRNQSECYPSSGNWGGRFTTYDTTTNETIVLTGFFEDPNPCPAGYYCPGKSNTEICVDLCPPKFFCPTPGELSPCEDGGYCPVASVAPRKCEGLESCNDDDLRRFIIRGASGVMVILIVVSIIYLYVGKWLIVRSARRQKEAKMAKAKAKMESSNNEEGEEAQDVDGVEPEAAVEDSGSSRPGLRQRLKERSRKRENPRRSTITAPEMTVDMEFDRLRLTIPGVGTIMRGVSGKIAHGNLTAIMGPSGAGKTTFLSLMSGKVDRTGGTINVNGEEAQLSEFRNVIGFVPQEDIMMRELTVEENIAHSALMRLPTKWPKEKKMARVDEVLESLEIDHIRDMVVGDERRRGISGGQRKRVNIAMEMVMKPSLCCLDEPTSGLDSTTSYTVVNSLKDMARAGANVITVLHQPKYEVFQLFDNVLLLGKGGMTVYYGKTSGMEEYFAKRGFPCPDRANPADYYMDVLSGIIDHESNEDWKKEDLFEEWMTAEENPDRMSKEEADKVMEELTSVDDSSDEDEKASCIGRCCSGFATELSMVFRHVFGNARGDKTGRKTPGLLKQFQLLFGRASLQRLRAPSGTLINIILMVIAGSVIPSLVPEDTNLYVGIPLSLNETDPGQEAYLQQNVRPVDAIPGVLLNVYMFLLIVSCLSVNVYGPERVVFFRETAVGQLVTSYWAAKSLECLLWLPIYTCAFIVLGYSSPAWLLQSLGSYWVYLFLALVGFYGFGMLASVLVGAGSAALLALVFGIIVIVGFSGAVTAYGDMNSGGQTFTNFWFLFWTTQGLCAEEYDQYSDRFNVTRLNDETPDAYDNAFGVGSQAVGAGVGMGYDLSSSHGRNIGMAALTAFAWYIIVLWALKTKDHRNHR
mmetsp:Transcript_33644/g.69975  ORF Transcript_33644/g.69975 Transcript_33644/m.69975 type:complete len:916 (-) Transcript_33644:135-2882(-)|eukprot:CAMPEP_0172449908 /NCGR_PEP_ID=MMETSP1065-20121228/8481_1 /TAXON_ID=265537 /ORGANISM="Amphiprora paludosa, Strain CCMP125" /LENGTH=915 /DNA_ID=CAMNT_0013201665 /DNA_START=51 /DNA_END=2798 /DNA_ORIENTATION=+